MSEYTVDVDREAVSMEGTWYTAEELAAKVTAMLGAKDFKIGTVASALEALQAALQGVRDIGFRLSGEMLEALEAAAGHEGRTTSAILREALATYLGSSPEAPLSAPVPAAAASPMEEVSGPPVISPAAISPSADAQSEGASSVTVESVSADEAKEAVTLTPKKREGGETESGWFGKK